MKTLKATVLHARFDAIPGFVNIHDIVSVSGHDFVWSEMKDGNYSVGWINPSDNVVFFLCQEKTGAGEFVFHNLIEDAVGLHLVGFAPTNDLHSLSADIIVEFGMGAA